VINAKKNRLRVLYSLPIIFFAAFISKAYALDLSSEEQEYLRTKGTIVFVSQTRYPPFEFIDQNGQHEGMMLDVVRWMAVEMGFKPVFMDMTFLEAQEAILSGRADILTSLFYSDKRNEVFDFTETLFDVPASIFVKLERTDIKDLNDLNGKTIAMQRGDYAKDFMEAQTIRFDTLSTEDFAQATDVVISGKADAVIGDEQIVLYHIFSNRLTEHVKKMGEPLYIGKNSMASHKNNAILIGILNKGIREAKKSGLLVKIGEKWLGTKYGPRESFLGRYLWLLAAVTGSLLLLSLVVWASNVRLRTLVRDKTEAILRREEALQESKDALSKNHIELQETAQRLERSRNMLQLIIESIPVRVFWKDKDLRYLGCNTLFARDAGFSHPDQILGLDDFSLGWREQAELYQADDRQVMESGLPKMNILEPQTTPAGSRIWLNTSKVPLHLPDGEVLGVLGVYEDITEQRQTAEALSLRESYLTAIIENQPGLLWLKDTESRFLAVNHAFIRSCGRQRAEEVIGKTDLDIWPRELAEKYADDDMEVMTRYSQITVEEPIFDQGIVKWFQTFKTPVFDTDGKVLGTCGFALDITERKQSEEERAQAKKDWEQTFDAVPELIAILDNDYRIVRVNRAMAAKLGMTPEGCAGLKCHQIIHGTNTPPSFCPHRRLLADHMEHTTEVFDERLGGDFIVSVSPLFDPAGGLKGSVHVCRDITESKRAAAGLRESEERYRQIAENIREVFWMVNVELDTIIYVSPAFEEIWGRTCADLYANPTSWLEAIHPDDKNRVIDAMSYRHTGGFNVEYRIVRPDGSIRWVLDRAFPVINQSQTVYRIAGIAEDITERKIAEEERRRLVERLQRAEKMEALGTLAGGVAHDLNNVLGIIVGYSELLSYDFNDSGSPRSEVVEILKAGQRAAAIVQDLLTLARRGIQNRQTLNLNSVLHECQKSPELAQVSSYNPKMEVLTDLEMNLLNISGSAVHLGKSFMNLVVNAAEAMPKGGTLRIMTRNQYLDKPVSGYDEVSEGDYVVLSVSDTGEGISANDLKRIFEPFYTKKVMGRSGTGLGLAVVWGTVKDHGGYINVESEEGKGTTFTVYIPVTRESIIPGQTSISASEYMGNGEFILIVDDIEEQRDLAVRMLTRLNYQVATAASGEKAVEYVEQHAVDLIVLDMIMDPGMDGLDTYMKILESHPHQKAIIVSGFSETERVSKAKALGAGAYVKKPYVLEKLGLAVRKELDKRAYT